MLEKFKRPKVFLITLLVLSWVIAIAVSGKLYLDKQSAIEDKQQEVDQLKGTLNQIGDLVPAYTLNSSVTMGQEIKATDYTTTQAPSTMAESLIQDVSELEGKYYRMDLKKGTALTKDNIKSSELNDDSRLYDIVLDTTPIGIKKGAYVDVRITLPLGQDFIAMGHKRVVDVNKGVLKLEVNEHDIHAYNSMLIDRLIYKGTQIYALEYSEGGVQKPADTFYPLSKKVTPIAQKDPNLISAIKADMLQKRAKLENGLPSVKASTPDEKAERDAILEAGRQQYSESYLEADAEFQARQEREAEKKAEEEYIKNNS